MSWSAVILSWLAAYAAPMFYTFLATLGLGLFTLAAAAIPSIWSVLERYAAGLKSEAVRTRIMDALTKTHHICDVLIASEAEMYKAEIKLALADGRIDNAEVKAIAAKLAANAMKIITPEIDTLKNYLTGECLLDYLNGVITTRMMDFVNAKATEKLNAMLGNNAPTATATATAGVAPSASVVAAPAASVVAPAASGNQVIGGQSFPTR